MNRSFHILLLVLSVAVLSSGAVAQLKNFTWDDGLCSYRGLYDPKKYSEAELRNTVKLFDPNEFNLITHSTAVFRPSDIGRLDVAKFDSVYRDMSANLAGLKIVKMSYFEELRRAKLKEMEQVWQLNRTTMLAFDDPLKLNEYTAAPACNQRLAGPLAKGGDDLMSAWLSVNMDMRAKNSDPERLRREFESKKASPERDLHARVDVLTFGWYNCANELIDYTPYDGKASEQFQKLLSRVRGQCDEP